MGQVYRHLSLDERIVIEKGREDGLSMRAIAKQLQRCVSTVSREIKRGTWLPINQNVSYRPYKTTRLTGPWLDRRYGAGPAHRKAAKRAARSHQPRLFTNDELVAYVSDKLRSWTPQMIAGRAPRDGLTVSHESIYRWIYSTKANTAKYAQYLPRGHKKRRHKHGRRVHSSHIPYRTPISQRPPEVDDRSQFGHWEGDTVLGAKADKDGIHTEVERQTRYLMAAKIPDLTAATTAATQLAMFTPLPPHAARSTTLDNGSENHRAYLLDQLAMPVWFADPYSSWQRGSNENRNGALRLFLPKGTPMATITDQDLQDIVNAINNRPMKLLDWDTPAERFWQLCLDQHTDVALQI